MFDGVKMETIKDFEQEKKKLINQFEKIEKMNIFPIETITLEEFIKQKDDLVNERFYVSFTGQIKAGKSTLINALIFSDDILPVDDLPQTAKITILKYAENPYFEVEFYSEKEWELLKNEIIKINGEDKSFFDIYLREDIRKANIKQSEVIGKPILKNNNLSNLNMYISKDGKYKPFVKLVTVYFNNDILKDVIFVDTPGINDPNPIRSKVTTNWIHKTDANIFLTYAKQAMSEQDFEFIDKYLFGVDTSKKITVINKIDTIDGSLEQLKKYINELKKKEDFKLRNIFGDDESIVYTSSLGGLIDKIYQKTEKIPKHYQEYAEKLESDINYLDQKKHNIDKLQKIIENKLIKNKGNHIIESKAYFLKTLFERKIRELEIIKGQLSNELSNYGKSESELKEKQKKYEDNIKKIDITIQEIKSKQEKEIDNIKMKFNDEINAFKRKLIDEILVDIKEIEKINHFKNEVLWMIKNNVEKEMKNIFEISNDIIKDLSEIIKDNLKKIEEKYKELEIMDYSLLVLVIKFYDFNIFEKIEKIKSKLDESFKSENIETAIKTNTDWYDRLFDTKTGIKNMNSSLTNSINKFFDDFFKNNFISLIEQGINEKINKILSNINEKIQEIIIKNQKEIKTIIENLNNQESLKKEKEDELNKIIKTIKQINIYKSEVFNG